MPERPWWTAADQAELDLLTHELVEVAFVHRERCAVCRDEGSGCCKPLCAAINVVLDFQRSRSLRSKVVWLRARQDFTDWAAA